MKTIEELVKKYFILLLVLLPLRKMGFFYVLAFGHEMIINYIDSFEAFDQEYQNILDIIELSNIYLINLIIASVVLMDIKPNRKLIGIPILTALMPIYGVILFFIHKYYSLNYLKLKHERTDQ